MSLAVSVGVGITFKEAFTVFRDDSALMRASQTWISCNLDAEEDRLQTCHIEPSCVLELFVQLIDHEKNLERISDLIA